MRVTAGGCAGMSKMLLPPATPLCEDRQRAHVSYTGVSTGGGGLGSHQRRSARDLNGVRCAGAATASTVLASTSGQIASTYAGDVCAMHYPAPVSLSFLAKRNKGHRTKNSVVDVFSGFHGIGSWCPPLVWEVSGGQQSFPKEFLVVVVVVGYTCFSPAIL